MSTLSVLRWLAEWLYTAWFVSYSVALVTALIWKYVTKCQSGTLETMWMAFGRVHQEVWPFALPYLVIRAAEMSAETPGSGLLMTVSIIAWWFSRNWPDDNIWKRRGKRAKEKVQARMGKLVVVPA